MDGGYRGPSVSFKTLASILKSNLVDVDQAWPHDSPFPSNMWEIYRGIVNDMLVLFLAHRHQSQGFVYGGHVFEQAYENFAAKYPTNYHISTKDIEFNIMARELLRICSDYVTLLSKPIAHLQLADYPQLLDVYSCRSFDTIANWTRRLLPCRSHRAYTPVSVYRNIPSPLPALNPGPSTPLPPPPRQIDAQHALDAASRPGTLYGRQPTASEPAFEPSVIPRLIIAPSAARSSTSSGYAGGLPSLPVSVPIVSTSAPNRQITHRQGGGTISGSSTTSFELDEQTVKTVTSYYQNLLEACALLVEQGASVAEYAESVAEIVEILADELRFIFDSVQDRLPREVRYWYDEFRMRDDHARNAPPELGSTARYDPAVEFYHRLQSVYILPLTETGIDINTDVEDESQSEPDSLTIRSFPTFFTSNPLLTFRSSSSRQNPGTRRSSPSPSQTPDHSSVSLPQSTRSSPTLVEADRAGSVWQGVSRRSRQQRQQTSWTSSPAVSDSSTLRVPDSPSPFRPASTLDGGSPSPKASGKKSARAVASGSGSRTVTPTANATSSSRLATPRSTFIPDDDQRRPQSQNSVRLTLSQNAAEATAQRLANSRVRGTPTTARHRTGTPGPSILRRPGTTSRSTNVTLGTVNSTLRSDIPTGTGAGSAPTESDGSGGRSIRIFAPAPSPSCGVESSAIPIQVGEEDASLSLGRRAGAADTGACISATIPGREERSRGNSNIPIHQPIPSPSPRIGESSVPLTVFHESPEVRRSFAAPSGICVPVQSAISTYLAVPGVNSSRAGSGGVVIPTGTATGSSVGINVSNGSASQSTPSCGGGKVAQTYARGENGVSNGSRVTRTSLNRSCGVGGAGGGRRGAVGRGDRGVMNGHCDRYDCRESGEVGVYGLCGSGHSSRDSRPCGCCFYHCGDDDGSDGNCSEDGTDARFGHQDCQSDLFPPVVDFSPESHSSMVLSGAMRSYQGCPCGNDSSASYPFPAKIHSSLLHNPLGYRHPVGLRWDVTQSPGEASFRTKYGILIPVGLDEDAVVVDKGRNVNVFPGSFKHKIWIEADSQYAANATFKWWMDNRWGPIRIEKQTVIKLGDVLSAIQDYFTTPLTLADYQIIVQSKTSTEFSNLDRLVAARRERGRRYEMMAPVMAEDIGHFGNFRRSDVLGTYLTFHGMRTEVRRDGSWVMCLSLGPEVQRYY
ncbi:hypothetical protein L218DRAFT_1078381 [Marasmius fiardii PR-910]|nr:hypothetical protein L218DRAFT_1078381 [Marasmius fiardii PR-910]